MGEEETETQMSDLEKQKLIEIAVKAMEKLGYYVDSDEVEMLQGYKWYGELPVFDAKGCEITIATEDQAVQAAKAYIKETLWAFTPEFLAKFTKAGDEDWIANKKWLIKGIKALSEGCEVSNDTLAALITDMDGLIEAALSMHGRGHFLSPYDEEEHEIKFEGETYYYYRLG